MALNGRIETGAMPENTARVVPLRPGEEFKIPLGYHDGTGTCKAYNLEENTPGDATPNDIVSTFKGYVNGVMVNGNLPEVEHASDYTSLTKQTNYLDLFFQRGVYTNDDSLELPYRKPQIQVPATEVARVCEITQDKLAHGTRVCDVAGSYSADATAMESDIVKNKVGFKMGQPLVGILKTMDIYNPGFFRNENGSVTFSWNNPANGPYGGIIIRYAWTPEGADNGTVLYQGYGSNKTPKGRSSITLSDLQSKIYYISIRSYCGPLISTVIFHFTIPVPTPIISSGGTSSGSSGSSSSSAVSEAPPPIPSATIKTNALITEIFKNDWSQMYNVVNFRLVDKIVGYDTLDVSVEKNGSILACKVPVAGSSTLFEIQVTTTLSSPHILYFDKIMDHMFQNTNIKILDLRGFDGSNVETMNNTFFWMKSVTTIYMPSGIMSKLKSIHGAFAQDTSLESLDLSNWDTTNVTDFGSLAYNCPSLTHIEYGSKFVNTSMLSGEKMNDGGWQMIPYACNKPNWTNGTWNESGTFIKD